MTLVIFMKLRPDRSEEEIFLCTQEGVFQYSSPIQSYHTQKKLDARVCQREPVPNQISINDWNRLFFTSWGITSRISCSSQEGVFSFRENAQWFSSSTIFCMKINVFITQDNAICIPLTVF